MSSCNDICHIVASTNGDTDQHDTVPNLKPLDLSSFCLSQYLADLPVSCRAVHFWGDYFSFLHIYNRHDLSPSLRYFIPLKSFLQDWSICRSCHLLCPCWRTALPKHNAAAIMFHKSDVKFRVQFSDYRPDISDRKQPSITHLLHLLHNTLAQNRKH